MCGLGAAMLTTAIARNLGREEGKLLKYAVGSQICDRGLLDQTGFASLAFIWLYYIRLSPMGNSQALQKDEITITECLKLYYDLS